MATEAPARGPRPATIVALVLLGPAMCGIARADEPGGSGTSRAPLDVPVTRDPAAEVAAAAEPRTVQPLWLPQSRSDWEEMVAVARVNPARTADASVDGFEEVVVTAPEDLLPMPGVYDQMWGGILAPVWAVLHPTQAWRIFLPVPQQ
jgi:hypothetical protein